GLCESPLQLVQEIRYRLEQCLIEEVERPEHFLRNGWLRQPELTGKPEQLDFILQTVDQRLAFSRRPSRRFEVDQPAVDPAVFLQHSNALGFSGVGGDDRPDAQHVEQRADFGWRNARLRGTGDYLGESS